MSHIPYLTGSGKLTQLIVDGKPFHARAGEIHNSSSSSLEYMEERVWPALRPMHMNCVVAPIFWECVEPKEGSFDFALIDGLIAQARRENVRLVFLWFGLWKNSASAYVPHWVKLDAARFPTVKGPGNKPLMMMHFQQQRIVTPLCDAAVEADAKAFAAVMKHLKETDDAHTVIAVQVENEIGVIGAARDHGPLAEAAFKKEIPEALAKAFSVSGTWSEAFGKDADETFMAWHYARAVERIIEAGKAELDLPMYVNAWLEQPPWTPGSYPSGGPQFKMHKVWRAAAPSVAFFAPDIYVNNYRDICEEYESDGNPLFIPEVRNSADAVAFYLYAVGAHNALCFSPFGVEDMMGGGAATDEATLSLLNISASALQASGKPGALLGDAYRKVEGMEDLLEAAHQAGKVHGFLSGQGRSEIVHLSHVDLEFSFGPGGFAAPDPNATAAGGLVVELGDYEFAVLATGCSMRISAPEGDAADIEILSKEEGEFQNGVWKRRRILNGDEGYMHNFVIPAELQKFSLFRD